MHRSSRQPRKYAHCEKKVQGFFFLQVLLSLALNTKSGASGLGFREACSWVVKSSC